MKKQTYVLGKNKIFVERFSLKEKKFKEPLLFVHGSFGGAFMWNKIVKYLTGKGFECVIFSLRGHKPSARVNLSIVGMEDYVYDIELVVRELELKNPVVIGHSMAGLLVLMYAKKVGSSIKSIISIDPSPSVEVQGAGDSEVIENIPLTYNVTDAGLPLNPLRAMKMMPDIGMMDAMKMRMKLGIESGKARRDRKKGISIPKNLINIPLLIIGGELGKSVPFGISIESDRKMANYYDADFVEIKGATHPGILMGKYAEKTAEAISNWVKK